MADFELPTVIGDARTFTAHGVTFRVVRHSRHTLILAEDVPQPPRARWGTAEDIQHEIAYARKHGTLAPSFLFPGRSTRPEPKKTPAVPPPAAVLAEAKAEPKPPEPKPAETKPEPAKLKLSLPRPETTVVKKLPVPPAARGPVKAVALPPPSAPVPKPPPTPPPVQKTPPPLPAPPPKKS